MWDDNAYDSQHNKQAAPAHQGLYAKGPKLWNILVLLVLAVPYLAHGLDVGFHHFSSMPNCLGSFFSYLFEVFSQFTVSP